ncbi:Gfo/Idh/MocA family protein [Xylanibacillus composti]|uniref:Gfo/Idh/MocA family oxidoreductase n=1 Tax=Xylanibacillus composti TaxID=1572762 RepID=A0A8J4H0T9_9BACL|nr:Gfo/Idh/MocA family oxidoreductase [Xylanibacillus composti]GIQ68804.1 hypothetical protein XYCOK13_16280 [Xylanibacillus composti]
MRFGLIGFSQGFYATTYTRHAARLKGIEVVACCDLGQTDEYVLECAGITAREFAEELGCELLSDLDAFFSRKLDAVMVASEVWQHAEHTINALSHGCHVFVGKPLSFRPDEVQAVIDKAREADRLVLPGNPLRYESSMQQIADQIRGGAIGKPTNIRVFVHHEAMVHQEWERDPAKSGGPLGTFGIYLIDTVRWLTGQELGHLYAVGGQFVFPEVQSWDTVQAVGATTEGALVQLNLVSTMTWEYPFVMVDAIGTKGVIHNNPYRQAYVLQNPQDQLGPIQYDPMGQKEIEHFIACCQGTSRPAITLDDMLAAAEGIQTMTRSLRSGTPQKLGDKGENHA